jgi:hypothetical protein
MGMEEVEVEVEMEDDGAMEMELGEAVGDLPLIYFSFLGLFFKKLRNEPNNFFSNLAFLNHVSPFDVTYEEVTPVHIV